MVRLIQPNSDAIKRDGLVVPTSLVMIIPPVLDSSLDVIFQSRDLGVGLALAESMWFLRSATGASIQRLARHAIGSSVQTDS